MKACKFTSRKEKSKKVRKFLEETGDDLPEEAIDEAVDPEEEMLDNFSLRCDENNEIISGATYKDNDWYLCSIKYLATRPEERGKGFGTEVVEDVLEKTKKDESCHVLSCDITYDNKPSKRIFKKQGFEEVNEFCWGEGKKPADVLQLVRFPPKEDKKCWREE